MVRDNGTPVLSIVVPSVGREAQLRRCLEACPGAVSRSYEIIVVYAGSDQAAIDYMAEREDVALIMEPERRGAVKAFNTGFRAARGKYATWLNDDAYPLAGAYDAALEFLQRPENSQVGLAALFHTWDVERNWAARAEHGGRAFGVFHIRGTLYANFGLGLTSLFRDLDYWDERFYLFGGDPDFSLKVWRKGLEVKPCPGALIVHQQLNDERKKSDLDQGARDNRLLFEKWDLPPINPLANDFDPNRPCTLKL